MRRLLLFFLCSSLSVSYSQETANMIDNSLFSCSYFGEELKGKVKEFQSKDSAYAVIQKIVEVVGLKPNFEIMSANIPNAAAVVYKGKRFVLYNDKFIHQVNKATGNKWAAISILAHEVGHHLNGHTLLNSTSRPDIELEADEFSGFVLRKMGATISDAQAAMNYITSDFETSLTHPGREDRMVAIASGWNTAQAQMLGTNIPQKTNSKIEVPVATKKLPAKEPSVLDEKYIAFDVYFKNDPEGNYYVTVRNNLVKVVDNNLYMAGVMAQSNKKYYVGMFYDRQFNYLYITKDLYIVNGSGRLVGSMKRRDFPFNIQ